MSATIARLIAERANCAVDCSPNCGTVRLMREDKAFMASLAHDLEDHAVSETPQGRCASCVHWQNPWDDDDNVPPADAPRWGVCALIEMPDYGETTTAVAFVVDGSYYKADLHSRDDFGCVLWTDQPTEDTQ